MQDKELLVSEIFGPTLQGEGASAGCKTMFLRLTGCDYVCSWCDTPYSTGRHKDESGELIRPFYERLNTEAIYVRLLKINKGCRTLTISGGNPALADLSHLIDFLHYKAVDGRWFINIETQGSKVQSYFNQADMVTLSPKPPSSGMTTDYKILEECVMWSKNPVLKVVVFDDVDYKYARDLHNCSKFDGIPFYIQVGNANVGESAENLVPSVIAAYRQLADIVVNDSDMQDVYVLPQLHTLLWGNRRLV